MIEFVNKLFWENYSEDDSTTWIINCEECADILDILEQFTQMFHMEYHIQYGYQWDYFVDLWLQEVPPKPSCQTFIFLNAQKAIEFDKEEPRKDFAETVKFVVCNSNNRHLLFPHYFRVLI